MFENTNLYTISRIKDSISTLNKLLYEVDYQYINNCRVVDVIPLFEGLAELYDGINRKQMRVGDLLQKYNIKGYSMIYIYDDNTRTDLLTWYDFNITQNLDLLYEARRGGLGYVYEMNGYRVEEGL